MTAKEYNCLLLYSDQYSISKQKLSSFALRYTNQLKFQHFLQALDIAKKLSLQAKNLWKVLRLVLKFQLTLEFSGCM